MKKILMFFILSIAAAAVLVSCGKNDKAADEVRIEIIDGIEHVYNPAVPKYPNRTVIFQEDLTISGEDEEGNVRVYQIGMYNIDGEGNIHISDMQMSECKIAVFDPDGRYLFRYGGKGQGPGEFPFPVSEWGFLSDGRIFVPTPTGISFFDSKGKFLESKRINLRLNDLLYAEDSFFICTHSKGFLENLKYNIKKHDYQGADLKDFGEFETFKMKYYKKDGKLAGMTIIPFAPYSIFAADHSTGNIYHCWTGEYVIDVYNPDGILIRKIIRPYNPVPVTKEEVEQQRNYWRKDRNDVIRNNANKIELPEFKPVGSYMVIDNTGFLWLYTNEVRREGKQKFYAWDIFDRNGIYEVQIWTDIAPEQFHKNNVYCRDYDQDTGRMFIKRYKVIWKDE